MLRRKTLTQDSSRPKRQAQGPTWLALGALHWSLLQGCTLLGYTKQ